MGEKTVRLGILVTIISGFGKKGFYHSQEIGLGEYLALQGHLVSIYKAVPSSEEYHEEKLRDGLEIKYVPTKKVGVHGRFDKKMIDPNLDGLLCFSDTQIFLPPIIKYCKKNNITFVPYIGIAHSFQQNTKSMIMDTLFRVGTLRYYRHLNVLAKTIAAKNELNSLGVNSVQVAPVGIDQNKLKIDFREADADTLKKDLGFSPEDHFILFVARLKPEKRPVDLIDILSKVAEKSDYKLIIIGEGSLKAKIEKRAIEKEVQSRVYIIDRVQNSEMWKYYRISDYFVNLRAEEIFGMAVMEAVYYETSVAAIDAPGPSTILDCMPGHKICTNDDEVANWILEEHPEQSILEEASNTIYTKFTWKNCADKFIEVCGK